MNFRSRALLDLAYELECTLRLPFVCEGGRGEPCHANWAAWGKGAGMKAHDFAFASGCRACHMELDQGKHLLDYQREGDWLRGHVETMRQLWERGLLQVNTMTAQRIGGFAGHQIVVVDERKAPRRKKRRATTAAANQVKRPAGGFA